MPGNASHTPRPPGHILTAEDYNSDFDHVFTHMTPDGIDDYSGTLAQMRAVMDPGEVGTEVFATSLGGEIEQLRFCIWEMKGTTYWPETEKVRCDLPLVLGESGLVLATMPPDSTSTIRYLWRVHPAWRRNTVFLQYWVRSAAIGTTAQLRMSTARYRVGATPVPIVSLAAVNFTPGNTSTTEFTYGITADQFTLGDTLVWELTRLGADPADTLPVAVELHGTCVLYTGYAGRPA